MRLRSKSAEWVTHAFESNTMLALGFVGVSVLFVSCRATFDYPDALDESDQQRCSNGTDDDFDGLIDCDDPSCDGFCREQDPVRCADGRDNDGDGLTDGRDAQCWHVAGPTASRCASLAPVDFEERFDGVLSEARWHPFGHDPVTGHPSAQLVEPTNREARLDRVLGFSTLPDDTLNTGVSSRVLFDGDWTSFELAFQGRIAGGEGLRVALAPGDLAPADAPPLAGTLLGSLAISVDGSGRVLLIADGAEQDAGSFAPGTWHDFLLERSGESLSLAVDGTVVRTSRAPALSASRLVVWGDPSTQFDDLHLRVAGSSPCGVATPQLPLCEGCSKDASLFSRNVGMTVSVARDEGGSFCALTTDGDVGQGEARGGSAWSSKEGKDWLFGGALPTEVEGDVWLGVSVARDAAMSQWRAVVVTDGVEGTLARRMVSKDCKEWTSEGSLPLPKGSHSPSYLLPGVVSQHEIYFALAPIPGEGPTLRRYRSEDGETFLDDGEAVVSFPVEAAVESPIAITRAGPRDVILTHRIAPKTGTLGLGLWVAEDDALAVWRRATNYPLLQTDAHRGGFDGEAIESGTVYWDGETGFALYGARGQPIWELHRAEAASSISVSTAALTVAGEPAAEAPFSDAPRAMLRPGSCGDGSCEVDETCTSCAADCAVCDGELIVFDAFEDPSSWSQDGTASTGYVSTLAERLVLSPGEPHWMVRELADAVVGDFEISFDVHWDAPEGATQDERCPALVGLAKKSDANDAAENVSEGVFVQLDQQLPCNAGVPAFSPYVRVGSTRYQSLSVSAKKRTCDGMLTGFREAWHHVMLQRSGGQARLYVSAGPGCGGVDAGQAISAYAGPLDALDRLAVGWGRPGWTEACTTAAAGLSIDNLAVRTLPCSQGGKSCTDPQTGEKVCVNIDSSPEHCGACNQRVEPGERCVGGEATCAGDICPVGASGLTVCTDTRTSRQHCGACGREVGPLEVCLDGLPVAAMVTVPGDTESLAIDVTEVTMGQYDAWLETDPLTSDQPPSCSWNESFESKCVGEPDDLSQPVTCINWCDAYAYCAAVGKRLCTTSAWRRVCAGGAAGNTYVYGSQYDPVACNGSGTQSGGSPLPCAPMSAVGSMSTCQSDASGYEGIYDMSGNVWEWVDNCIGDAPDAVCNPIGGSNCDSGPLLSCSADYPYPRQRNFANANIGVRCCAL